MARPRSVVHVRPIAVACAAAALALLPSGARAEKKGPGTIDRAKGTFSPAYDPAATYGVDVGRCPTGGAFRLVENELDSAAKKAGKPPPRSSNTLCAVAETFLGWDPAADGKPRDGVLAGVSQWFGLAAPVTEVLVATIEGLPNDETAAADVIAEKVVAPAGNFWLKVPAPRWGMATQRVRRGVVKVALALQSEPAKVTKLPRRIELGKAAGLELELAAGTKDPRVLVSDPLGALADTKGATAEVKCAGVAGRAFVEVRGEVDGGSAVLASFPVGCGVDLPAAVAIAPEPWPATSEQQEKRILERLNAERKAAGRGPLADDADLVAISRQMSASFASGGGGGDVAALIKEGGIWSPVVAESAAADRAIDRVWDRLMRSPTNRQNLLNPEVDGAGVGIATGAVPDGGTLIYVTLVLVKEQAPIDVVKAREALRAAVVQKRKDARVGAVERDPALDDLAQKYADALGKAGGNLSKADAAALLAPAQAQWKVTAIAGARAEPLDIAEEPEVIGNGKVFGAGMATGKHPKLGRHAAYAVILIGAPQGGAAPKPAAKPSKKAK